MALATVRLHAAPLFALLVASAAHTPGVHDHAPIDRLDQQCLLQQRASRAGRRADTRATLKLDDADSGKEGTGAGSDASAVLAFYYLWYGNLETDGRYMHWNHSVLPHWTPGVNERYPDVGKPHNPPGRIHAKFYPARGCYSVADPVTLQAQMMELHQAGVDTVVLSWWGRPGLSTGDSQGVVTDDRIAGVLQAAASVGVFVAWHMEPYEGRSAASFREDVRYLNAHYGQHPALLKRVQPNSGRALQSHSSSGPVYFVYDSYHIPADDWASVLGPPDSSSPSSLSIRGTLDDGTFVGLWLDASHGADLSRGHFDGAYTYFASVGFSWGSTLDNWATIRQWASTEGKLFVASVGPGYNDEGIRPWNAHNTKPRAGGAYYAHMWERAIANGADMVSITSYNEWGEGTQIEPAVARGESGLYNDYESEGGPTAYMDKTRAHANAFRESKRWREAPAPVPKSEL